MLIEANGLPIGRVSKCYGKQISAECESQHLMRVVSSTYLRSRDCVGGASDLPLLGAGNDSMITTCRRDDVSGPQCVGNSSCIFTAPWIYISADCGYSNYFSLRYQCIPGAWTRIVAYLDKKAQLTQGLRATGPPSSEPEIAPYAPPTPKTLA